MFRYARTFYKDTYLKETSFFHIFHNLDVNYEGRIYLSQAQNDMYWIHHLNTLFLIDPYWKNACINPSRSVLFTTDNWATVSYLYSFLVDVIEIHTSKRFLTTQP